MDPYAPRAEFTIQPIEQNLNYLEMYLQARTCTRIHPLVTALLEGPERVEAEIISGMIAKLLDRELASWLAASPRARQRLVKIMWYYNKSISLDEIAAIVRYNKTPEEAVRAFKKMGLHPPYAGDIFAPAGFRVLQHTTQALPPSLYATLRSTEMYNRRQLRAEEHSSDWEWRVVVTQ